MYDYVLYVRTPIYSNFMHYSSREAHNQPPF